MGGGTITSVSSHPPPPHTHSHSHTHTVNQVLDLGLTLLPGLLLRLLLVWVRAPGSTTLSDPALTLTCLCPNPDLPLPADPHCSELGRHLYQRAERHPHRGGLAHAPCTAPAGCAGGAWGGVHVRGRACGVRSGGCKGKAGWAGMWSEVQSGVWVST